jgi:hypothetical protein
MIFGCGTNSERVVKKHKLGEKIQHYSFFNKITWKTYNVNSVDLVVAECDVDTKKYTEVIKNTYRSYREESNEMARIYESILSKWDNAVKDIDKIKADLSFFIIRGKNEIGNEILAYKIKFKNGKECSSSYGFTEVVDSIMKNEPYPDMLDFIVLCHQNREPSLMSDSFKIISDFGSSMLDILRKN